MDERPVQVDRRVDTGNEGLAQPGIVAPSDGELARLVAAWDIAGPVNRLNWELQIGLLKNDEFDGRIYCADFATAHLSVQAMDLVEPVIEKDSLRDVIREAWSESEFIATNRLSLQDKTGHLHSEAEQRLRNNRRDYDAFQRVHEEECQKIIAPCRQLVEAIRKVLEHRMTERQLRVHRLSLMLEQLTFREDVFRSTFIWFLPKEDGGEYEPPKYFAAAKPESVVPRLVGCLATSQAHIRHPFRCR